MAIVFIWIIVSLIVGAMGSNKSCGFAGAFFGSLLLSPLIGLIIIIASKENPKPKQEYKCRHCGKVTDQNYPFCPACDKDDSGKTKEDYKNKTEPQWKVAYPKIEEENNSINQKTEKKSKLAGYGSFLFVLFIAGLVYFIFWVANAPSKKQNETEQIIKSADSVANALLKQNEDKSKPKDTTYYFVKRLLNCSPKEVQNVLGKPDDIIRSTNDCVFLPKCNTGNYQHGKYEVEYFNNRLKCITINFKGTEKYNEQFLGMLDFVMSPTVKNDFNIRWKGNNGIKEIVIFPNTLKEGIEYCLIEVESDFDKKIFSAEEKAKNDSILANERR